MKLTSYVTNTDCTRFAFRFWRIGFGVFKPGYKAGWFAIYTNQAAGSTPAASFQPRWISRQWVT
jgi:hypothetical protein